jgi:carboxyl-terminal processing protease
MMHKKRSSFFSKTCLMLLVTSLVSLGAGGYVFAGPSQSEEPTTATIEIPAQEEDWFYLFRDVKDLILLLYPGEVTVQTLYQGAIRGLFESLGDPYSQYLDKEEYASLSQEMEGEFSGIGVGIQLINGNITVVSVFKDSPAEKAGLRPGDVILEVDGVDLRGKGPEDASGLLKGDARTGVSVTVLRPSTGQTLTVHMIRARISAYPIEMKDLGDGMFYVRISQFTSTTGEDFSVLMEWMRHKGAKGLVLDLRNNPGGRLDSAIQVAAELVPEGPIVQLKQKDVRQVIWSDKETEPMPTVILVNGGTASASEIVAGAIRDRGKGILVGERTFGKACVQAMVPLGDDLGGFKLTIADYYTPAGTAISGVGLKPNVLVKKEPLELPNTWVYKREIKVGTVGLDVLALQDCLRFLGYDPGPSDGIFGKKTQEATVSFLKDYDRSFPGSLGEAEASAINAAVSEKAVNAPDVVLKEGKTILKHWLELEGNR